MTTAPKRILMVGGVAGGASCAARARFCVSAIRKGAWVLTLQAARSVLCTDMPIRPVQPKTFPNSISARKAAIMRQDGELFEEVKPLCA
ncbi:MAG: hypothetical protein WBA57_19190 [Elainellaceae cyanobacterium]